jgi:hypothetical protein
MLRTRVHGVELSGKGPPRRPLADDPARRRRWRLPSSPPRPDAAGGSADGLQASGRRGSASGRDRLRSCGLARTGAIERDDQRAGTRRLGDGFHHGGRRLGGRRFCRRAALRWCGRARPGAAVVHPWAQPRRGQCPAHADVEFRVQRPRTPGDEVAGRQHAAFPFGVDAPVPSLPVCGEESEKNGDTAANQFIGIKADKVNRALAQGQRRVRCIGSRTISLRAWRRPEPWPSAARFGLVLDDQSPRAGGHRQAGRTAASASWKCLAHTSGNALRLLRA